ncbi:hypothetical protein HMPREF0043_01678, partial [Actinobaculum sp. oral taxon 183 str. F0552]
WPPLLVSPSPGAALAAAVATMGAERLVVAEGAVDAEGIRIAENL